MASYEERISDIEVKATQIALELTTLNQKIAELHNKLISPLTAFAISYDEDSNVYRIYLPYGSLCINSRIIPINQGATGWVLIPDSPSPGPVVLNIFKNGNSYRSTLDRSSDDNSNYSFIIANIGQDGSVVRMVDGALILNVDDEVRAAFDVIELDGSRYMFLPLNGTVSYGGVNYFIHEASPHHGWMPVSPGRYYCWAVEGEPYAHVGVNKPSENLKFIFEIGVVK